MRAAQFSSMAVKGSLSPSKNENELDKDLYCKLYKFVLICFIQRNKGRFTWRRASPPRRASPLCRDLTLQVYSFIEFFFRLHERRASPPRQDLAIQFPRSRRLSLKRGMERGMEWGME